MHSAVADALRAEDPFFFQIPNSGDHHLIFRNIYRLLLIYQYPSFYPNVRLDSWYDG